MTLAGVGATRAGVLLAMLALGPACSPPAPRSGPVTIVFQHARILEIQQKYADPARSAPAAVSP